LAFLCLNYCFASDLASGKKCHEELLEVFDAAENLEQAKVSIGGIGLTLSFEQFRAAFPGWSFDGHKKTQGSLRKECNGKNQMRLTFYQSDTSPLKYACCTRTDDCVDVFLFEQLHILTSMMPPTVNIFQKNSNGNFGGAVTYPLSELRPYKGVARGSMACLKLAVAIATRNSRAVTSVSIQKNGEFYRLWHAARSRN